ncbi:hypothetical protein QYE76_026599 [Lolium multiflorum]|uniref:Uncharacterized protein n=1 Tax=Lolium multiflorum TaxID=4521 RepID=A0AAD8RHK6_LOLMU|nr:hypothetical protein QYE76_026599 [Lolium multiflorum]
MVSKNKDKGLSEEEVLRITDEFCDQYRALRREVEILQEENCRLRRMIEYHSIRITRTPSPTSDNNESLRDLVQICQAEKLKLKEIYDEGSQKEGPGGPGVGPHPRRRGPCLAAPPCGGGTTTPFASFSSRNPSSRRPKPREESSTKGLPPLRAENTERKELSGAGIRREIPQEEIDAIVTAIELDIISTPSSSSPPPTSSPP